MAKDIIIGDLTVEGFSPESIKNVFTDDGIPTEACVNCIYWTAAPWACPHINIRDETSICPHFDWDSDDLQEQYEDAKKLGKVVPLVNQRVL